MAPDNDGQWRLDGADGQPILGDVIEPSGEVRGVAVVLHGLMGYKDYGMLPYLARSLAGAGFIAHRYNASHSGITRNIDTFERPDLFEHDTWNKQAFDLERVLSAIDEGELPGQGKARLLVGHSRGGAVALLVAGRRCVQGRDPGASAIVAIATPSSLCRRGEDERARIREGQMELTSSRTGQTLRVGPAWLTEQEQNPGAHDLPALAGAITCPVLLVQGTADSTVDVRDSHRLEEAIAGGAGGARVERVLVPGADHVFRTENPMALDQLTGRAPVSPELRALTDEMLRFAKAACVP